MEEEVGLKRMNLINVVFLSPEGSLLIPACRQREVKRLLALLCMEEQRRGPSSPKLNVPNPIPAPSSGNPSLG